MNELQKILRAYHQIDFTQKRAALATVVNLYGSSYRRPGARMLMTEDGHWTGAISGGCLEGDALRKARKAILEGSPAVVTYNTMQDEGAGSLAVSLGCNGIIEVLIEPLGKDGGCTALEMLQASQKYPATAAIATVFRTKGDTSMRLGDRFLRLPDGKTRDLLQDRGFSSFIQQATQEVIHKQSSQYQCYTVGNSTIEVFIEALNPGIQLYVFGGGYDAVPVTQLGKQMGWQVIVSDDCPAHLSPKRFTHADEVVCIPRESVQKSIRVYAHSAALLMSHNYSYDLAILRQLLSTPIAYIGLLGPKKRFEKMQQDLAHEGILLHEGDRERIYSPVGLDIGAETPEEIALSVVAEIQARFHHGKGSFLKDKTGCIHPREVSSFLSSRK